MSKSLVGWHMVMVPLAIGHRFRQNNFRAKLFKLPHRCKSLLAVTCILSLAALDAQAQNDFRPSRAWVADHIYRNVRAEFDRMTANQNFDYGSGDKRKAAAVCVNWADVGYWNSRASGWGATYGVPENEDPGERALRHCRPREQAGQCKCELLEVDDKIVLRSPDSAVDKAANQITEIVSKTSSQTRGDRVLSDTLVIDQIERTLAIALPLGSRKVELNLPDRLSLKYIDCAENYNCACRGQFRYSLDVATADVSLEIEKRARAAAKVGLFGCYQKSPDVLADNFSQGNRQSGPIERQDRCRFVAHIDGERLSAASGRLEIPPRAIPLLHDKKIRGIWVEAGVRVDKRGNPIEAPLTSVHPILIETDAGALVGREIVFGQESGGGCYLSSRLTHDAIHLRSCRQGTTCGSIAIQTLMDSMRRQLEALPFEAQLDLEQPTGPGELWVRRDHKKSNLLGAPYFEDSNYILKWWNMRDGLASAYSEQKSKGTIISSPATPSIIYVSLTSSVLISVGVDGTYRSADDKQKAQYSGRLLEALTKAISEACEKASGRVELGRCLLE